MKKTVFTLKAAGGYPFHLQAVQYLPDYSVGTGFTLIFLHAMNLFKEAFEPMLAHLLQQASRAQIRDVWCIENPNHAGSADLNKEILSTAQYRGQWKAADYSQAVHHFLTSTTHGIDFTARTLVGVAQSGASPSLLLLQDRDTLPGVHFEGLIFLDPAILPAGKASSQVLCKLFGNWAKSKRRTWPSRDAALEQLSGTAFKRWDPQAVRLFVKHALRPTGDGAAVTLACSPEQEAAFYLSPDADLVNRPFEIFLQLVAADQLPIHIIVCPNDEYKGKTAEMKQTQISHVKTMSRGSVEIVEGGHMFPQTEPVLCTETIVRALDKIHAGLRSRL
ncbi:alpha/beta-hydrolase [Mycena filopes]|nr:alpha/beta-hydrolase [Mycena filopes]